MARSSSSSSKSSAGKGAKKKNRQSSKGSSSSSSAGSKRKQRDSSSQSNAARKRASKRKQSPAQQTPQQAARRPMPMEQMGMMHYGGSPPPGMWPGMWPHHPPPWGPPAQHMPTPQENGKRDKKDKKDRDRDKKDKKGHDRDRDRGKAADSSKVTALQEKLAGADALRKEAAEALQTAEAEKDKLKAEVEKMKTQLVEAQETQKQEAARDRSQLKSYAKELNAKSSEIRHLQEEREKRVKEIAELQAACSSEREKRKQSESSFMAKTRAALADRDSQISHLTSVREGLLTTISKLKEQNAALKARVKKVDVRSSLDSSDLAAEAGGTGSSQQVGSAIADTTDMAVPAKDASRAKKSATSQRALKAPRSSRHDPLHRDASVGSSILRKRGERSKNTRRISCKVEECLVQEVRVRSYAGLKKELKRILWTPKAGSTLACDACGIRAPLSSGNLMLDSSKGQFMQERFLCSNCGGEPATAGPAANLLLADSKEGIRPDDTGKPAESQPAEP